MDAGGGRNSNSESCPSRESRGANGSRSKASLPLYFRNSGRPSVHSQFLDGRFPRARNIPVRIAAMEEAATPAKYDYVPEVIRMRVSKCRRFIRHLKIFSFTPIRTETMESVVGQTGLLLIHRLPDHVEGFVVTQFGIVGHISSRHIAFRLATALRIARPRLAER